MNERIQELAKQAGIGSWGINSDNSTEIFQKFAELIVKECAIFAYDYCSDQENVKHYGHVGWECLPGDLRDEIEIIFGEDFDRGE